MKQGIHPDYHEITVLMTNGDSHKTMSTYGKEGSTIQLDIDITTHPAWTGGGAVLNKKKGKAADFNKKFGSINFSAKKKESEKSESEENAEGGAESK